MFPGQCCYQGRLFQGHTHNRKRCIHTFP
jgi:uncharacterized protein (DUF983 family)